MTVGRTPKQEPLYNSPRELCAKEGPKSVYRMLAEHGAALFPDEAFADLFDGRGRRSVPPQVVATVMVLQRLEGLSDREAVERVQYDIRWKYACNVPLEYEGFDSTVLVKMRMRLRKSERPNRVFDAVLEVAKQAGLVGRRRVLDSTALYDAVTTQDTVTMIRWALRGLLRSVESGLAARIEKRLSRDDYEQPGKPRCAWDEPAAREALVDEIATDALAALEEVEGASEVSEAVKEAAQLLATVVGQDVEIDDAGKLHIARGVATDRVISTVDPEARHGHKTSSRAFDGYKAHVAVDPDSEIVTQVAVTPGNGNEWRVARDVVEELSGTEGAEVYGDSAYGAAELVEELEAAGIEANVRVGTPAPRCGRYAQSDFAIDTEKGTVTCPAGVLVQLRVTKGVRTARFGKACKGCSQRERCTDSKGGRLIAAHVKYDVLQRARARQSTETWKEKYRAHRPKVERKIAHLMRRRHGGRRVRVRGVERVQHDTLLLAAGVNLCRLAALGVVPGV